MIKVFLFFVHKIAYELTFLAVKVEESTLSEEETVNAKPLQTVLPSPKRSTRVKQRAAKQITKVKKQPIKTEVLICPLFRLTNLKLFP